MRVTPMAVRWTVALLAIAVSAGCGDYELGEPRGRSAAPEAVGVVVDPASLAEPVGRRAPDTPPAEATTPTGPATSPASPQAPAAAPPAAPQVPGYQPPMSYQAPKSQANMIREKAEVGMGRKGHYRPGMITTPLATFWRSQEAVAYKMHVPHALNLYKATHGHFPKTQEEFVREILQPNRIKLPELPAGHIYVYDPDKGELQVARPR